MKPKPVYMAFSFFEFIRTLLLRLACLFALIYSLAHFDENPVVISIFAGICLLFIFIIGDDQITVYPNKVVHATNSLASFIFSKGKAYNISELKHARLKGEETPPNAFETGVILTLIALLPKRSRSGSTSKIFFDTKEGKTLQLDTYLSQSQIEKVIETVNQQISKSNCYQ